MTDQTDSAAGAPRSKRRRLVPIVWIAGAAATAMLGLTITGTLSGFTASIYNDTNTAASGTLLMQETNNAGTVSCYSNGSAANTAIDTNNKTTCSTINKLGGDQAGGLNLAPGATGTSTTVKIKNTGTISASSFTLTPATTCQQSNNTGNTGVAAYGTATDFCSKVNVTITKDGTTVFQGTAAQLAGATGATTALPANLGATAAGATAVMVFNVSLDTSAGNTYQGLGLSLPMTWKFTQ